MITTPPRPQVSAPDSGPVLSAAERIANLHNNDSRNPAGPGRTGNRPTRRTGKRHAAKGSRAMALALSVTTSVGLAGGLYYADHAGAVTSTATKATSSTRTGLVAAAAATIAQPAAQTAAATSTQTAAATSPATSVAASANGLVSGTYDGASIDTRYGPVQVEIAVANGQISTVTVIASPDADRKSVQINSNAVPTLNSETMSAQTANIDSVSGATYTSDAYKQSLQSALDQARV